MRTLATLGLGLVLGVCGCGSRPDPGPGAPGPTPERPPATTPRRPETVDPPPTPPPVAPRAPDVRIVGAPAAPHVAISVTNASDEPVQLAKALVVEVAHGATWAPLEHMEELSLRSDCDSRAPDCLTLVPGATLEPPAWLGTIGDAQCACEHCVEAPAGRYRFVARTCGGARIEGQPFELTR